MTIGSSILLIAVGAILRYAITAHVSGINIQTAGTIMLILGIVGLILAVIYTFYWSRAQRPNEVRVRDERDPRYNDPRY
jgi:beta-lactamase regulating signal transducer with metallopeptidase domain